MMYVVLALCMFVSTPFPISARVAKKIDSFRAKEEARLEGRLKALKDLGGSESNFIALRDLATQKGFLAVSRQAEEERSRIAGISAPSKVASAAVTTETPQSIPATVAAKSVTEQRRDVVRSLELVGYGMQLATNAGNMYGVSTDLLRERRALLDKRAYVISQQRDPQYAEWYKDAVVAMKKIAEAVNGKAKGDALGLFAKVSGGFRGSEDSQLAELLFQMLMFLTSPDQEHTIDAEGLEYKEVQETISSGKKHFTSKIFAEMTVMTICTQLAEDSMAFTQVGPGMDTKDAMWIEALLIVAGRRVAQGFSLSSQIKKQKAELAAARENVIRAMKKIKEVPVIIDEAKKEEHGYIAKLANQQAKDLRAYQSDHPEKRKAVEAIVGEIAPVMQKFALLEQQLQLLTMTQAGAGELERSQLKSRSEFSAQEVEESVKDIARKKPSILSKVMYLAGGVVGVAILASMAAGAAREASDDASITGAVDRAEGAVKDVWVVGDVFKFFLGAGATAYRSVASGGLVKSASEISVRLGNIFVKGIKAMGFSFSGSGDDAA